MVSFAISANVCFDMDKKNIFRSFFLSIDGVGKQNSLKPRRERRKRKQTKMLTSFVKSSFLRFFGVLLAM